MRLKATHKFLASLANLFADLQQRVMTPTINSAAMPTTPNFALKKCTQFCHR
jgi:hypothetical protein